MKFSTKSIAQGKTILANDHYVAIPYDCTALSSLAKDGVIEAGTIVPANDATAVGVLLTPVVIADNPNGTIVVHGFINGAELPSAASSAAKTALAQIKFM